MIAMLQALIVITTANATPVLASLVFRSRLKQPLDLGKRLADGNRILGPSKTIRGVITAIVATAAAAWLLGLPPLAGGLAAALAMLGDVVSSFAKRRLGLPSSSRFYVLDQAPEAVLPLLALIPLTTIDGLAGIIAALVFILLSQPVSWLLYRIGIRGQPY